MRIKRNWLNCTLLSLLLVFALLVGACAAPATTGDGADTAMEDAGDEMAELPGIQYAVNPDTVDSDRLLVLPGRTRFGVGMWGGITAGNWNFGSESFYMVQMPLIFMGPLGNTTPTPWMARRIERVDDNMAMEIELYPDAVWSDGERITTADVAFTFELLYHADADYWLGDAKVLFPNITGGQDYFEGKADSISGIKIIDDFNMRIEADEPIGLVWRPLAFLSVLPEHHLGQYTAAQLWAGDFPDAWVPEVTSGPYRVVSWDEEAKVLELQRNEDWWGNAIYGKPGIKRYAEQSGLRLENFLEGQSDVIKIGAADYGAVLLHAGSRSRGRWGLAPTMGQPRSLLEMRLKTMSEKRKKVKAAHGALLGAATLAALGVACDVTAPTSLEEAIEEVVADARESGETGETGDDAHAAERWYERISRAFRSKAPTGTPPPIMFVDGQRVSNAAETGGPGAPLTPLPPAHIEHIQFLLDSEAEEIVGEEAPGGVLRVRTAEADGMTLEEAVANVDYMSGIPGVMNWEVVHIRTGGATTYQATVRPVRDQDGA